LRDFKKISDSNITEIPEALGAINDILGVRLICLYKNELRETCDWVEANFETINRKIFTWDGLGDLKPSEKELQRTFETGYTSIHYIVTLKTPQFRSFDGKKLDLRTLKFEIQVRTLLEEAWGEFTHSTYEDPKAPFYIVKSYQILSENLNIINKQVELLRNTYSTLSNDQIQRELIEEQEFRDKELNFLDFQNFTIKNLNFLIADASPSIFKTAISIMLNSTDVL
jgi:ppGpp synthetase/RelA/SpoT-type nucleotidyltranferase